MVFSEYYIKNTRLSRGLYLGLSGPLGAGQVYHEEASLADSCAKFVVRLADDGQSATHRDTEQCVASRRRLVRRRRLTTTLLVPFLQQTHHLKTK